MSPFLRTDRIGPLFAIGLAVAAAVLVRCTATEEYPVESEWWGTITSIDTLPGLPAECTAVTLNDSSVYFIHGSPPVLQIRLLRSTSPETLFIFPETSHPVHIAVQDDRIAISDAGMSCIWTRLGDSITVDHYPGVYRRLTPLSSAWLTSDTLAFSGVWLSRAKEGLSVHHGIGSYDLSTGGVRFHHDVPSPFTHDTPGRHTGDLLVGNAPTVYVIRSSGNNVVVQPWDTPAGGMTSITFPSGYGNGFQDGGLRPAGCVPSDNGMIHCMVCAGDSIMMVTQTIGSDRNTYYTIPVSGDGWFLIGAAGDLIVWHRTSGELAVLSPVHSVS